MKGLDTNLVTDIAGPENRLRAETVVAEFDPASVFHDPISYLERFGLRAELAEPEPRRGGLPEAA